MIRSTVLALMLILFNGNAHALAISFSFDEDGVADFGGTPVAGSVTGVISGLQDNLSNQLAGVTVDILSFPAGLGGAINNGLRATDWSTVVGTGFDVLGGIMTGANFAAQTFGAVDPFDQIRLNFDSFNLLTLDGAQTITGNSDAFDGTMYSPSVPEPTTLLLLGLGLAGLGFARRRLH